MLPADKISRQVDTAPEGGLPARAGEPDQHRGGLRAHAPRCATTPATWASCRAPPGPTPPRRIDGETSLIQVFPARAELSDESQELVRDVRDRETSFTALAGGQTADFVDLKESLMRHLPLALLIVAASTIAVLFLMTGSVVLPIKALLMNVLTLSATFGLLVLIFQDGRLEGLLGYTSQGALEATMPVLLFAVAFGLSTDYGVFLLSRIKEARDAGASDSESVAIGLRAHRADRDRRGAAVQHRDRRVRHLGDHLHQGERRGHGAGRADRRDDHPRAAGAVADGAARSVELVGAAAAAQARMSAWASRSSSSEATRPDSLPRRETQDPQLPPRGLQARLRRVRRPATGP